MKKALLLSLFVVGCGLFVNSAHAQSVDLLWEGKTYTPPFYQGGALWSNQSTINFVAIPQGFGNPGNLIYKWSRNGTVLGSISGVGRNTLSFGDTIFSKPVEITVEIVNANDETLAQTSTVTIPSAPNVLIYEQHPLYGFLFNQEVSSAYRLRSGEVTFAAFPLFFNAFTAQDNALHYSWRSAVGEDSQSHLVTYRVADDAAGQSSVSLKVSNITTLRQAGEKNFLIQFGDEE